MELLAGYEGDIFDFTGDVERDLLSITAVHPMRKEAVEKFLESMSGGNSEVNGRGSACGGRILQQHVLLEEASNHSGIFCFFVELPRLYSLPICFVLKKPTRGPFEFSIGIFGVKIRM